MENSEKQKIQKLLREYVKQYDSQNKAAASLKDVSSATVSQVLNNKTELVNDNMWRNIGSQVGYKTADWVIVDTSDFKEINTILTDAQEQSLVMAFVAPAGAGKSAAAKEYKKNSQNVYLLSCNEYWQKTDFLNELAFSMGRDVRGFNTNQMMNEIVRNIKSDNKPLIIMDEGDKLKDQVLRFFITLYNQLEDHCGIVICATDHLEKRIKRGLVLNKQGYNEMFSRVGRRFIPLEGANYTDVYSICMANGVKDRNKIKQIFKDCSGDLRRVKRVIMADRIAESKLTIQ